jgi:putative membrane protein
MTELPSSSEPIQESLDLNGDGASQVTAGHPANDEGSSVARLHWSSLFFDIISHSRNYLIPAVIALFSAAKGNSYGVIFAGLFFFPSLAVSLFRYFTFKYRVHNRQLVVEQGLIFRRVRTVPVERIQNIDLVQNVLHRLFGVGEVRVETASGGEPEAVLRVLTLQQVEQLRNEIFGNRSEINVHPIPDFESGGAELRPAGSCEPGSNHASDIAVDRQTSTVRSSAPSQVINLVEMKLTWLVLAGLASNRGMIMVGIGFGLLYQTDMMDQIDLQWIQGLIPANLDRAAFVGLGLAGLLALMVLLRILGVGWYLLRFFGYRLTSRGDDLQISCGLLTKVSATVPRKRIQLISIHQNLILKWMGLTSLRIETAGGTSDQEDASKSVSRRWFLPVVPESELASLLFHLRPDFDWLPKENHWIKVAPRAFARKSRKLLIISILVGVAGYYVLPPWGWLLGLIALPLLLIRTYLDLKSIGYARLEQGVVFKSGFFDRKTSYTFLDKLQTLRVDQSPFDKRWKMASLTIDTAGAGPAEHALTLSLFESDAVIKELQALKRVAAQCQPDFGGR